MDAKLPARLGVAIMMVAAACFATNHVAARIAFDLAQHVEPVLRLMQKYADVPMSLADACLVRMTEIHADPIVLTTDEDFRIYRRHSRHVVPCVTPG